MKEHITVEQLNELSEKGRERLSKWWKPSEGDWYFIPKGIEYGSGYGMWEKEGWEEDTVHCIGYGELGIGTSGNRNYKGDIEFKAIRYGEYGDDNYYEIPLESIYPLFSIGQMIEFLGVYLIKTYGRADVDQKGKIKKHFKMVEIEWHLHGGGGGNYKGNLCDSLWEAVKEILDKPNN